MESHLHRKPSTHRSPARPTPIPRGPRLPSATWVPESLQLPPPPLFKAAFSSRMGFPTAFPDSGPKTSGQRRFCLSEKPPLAPLPRDPPRRPLPDHQEPLCTLPFPAPSPITHCGIPSALRFTLLCRQRRLCAVSAADRR